MLTHQYAPVTRNLSLGGAPHPGNPLLRFPAGPSRFQVQTDSGVNRFSSETARHCVRETPFPVSLRAEALDSRRGAPERHGRNQKTAAHREERQDNVSGLGSSAHECSPQLGELVRLLRPQCARIAHQDPADRLYVESIHGAHSSETLTKVPPSLLSFYYSALPTLALVGRIAPSKMLASGASSRHLRCYPPIRQKPKEGNHRESAREMGILEGDLPTVPTTESS